MKKVLYILMPTFLLINFANAQVNPYINGVASTLGAATNQEPPMVLPGGVRVYNQAAVAEALYGTSNMNNYSPSTTVQGNVSQPEKEVEDTSAVATTATSDAVETSSDSPITQKQLEEMNKRNDKIMEDLKNQTQKLQQNSVANTQQTKAVTTTERKTGQVLDIHPKHKMSDISDWNKTTIMDFENKAKQSDEEKYLNFLQNGNN